MSEENKSLSTHADGGEQAVAYVNPADLEKLKDKRVAGAGIFLSVDKTEKHSVAIYPRPSPAANIPQDECEWHTQSGLLEEAIADSAPPQQQEQSGEAYKTCDICDGAKGGVPGNGNLINGQVVCDYCHADGSYPSPAKATDPKVQHDSDCSLHNGPAYEPGPCDCSVSLNATDSEGQADRFFQDHGLWHDRVTGQHMYTQDQYDELRRDAFHNGYQAGKEALEETYKSGIEGGEE